MGAESNNYRRPLHLSSKNTGLDASFVTAVPTSRNLFSESQVPSNDSCTVNHDSFDNSGSRADIRVSSPHKRTEALSQSRSSSNNNVHSIVAKWNINYSGKRDSSAEEFLMRVEECRRGSSLTDEDLFRALPFLLKPLAQYWFRFNSTKWESWAELVAAFKRRYGGINLQTRVRDEGRRRTQGPEEPIADYLLNIRLIFQHYDPPISEYEQLQLAINNLYPSYIGALPKLDYRSFDELAEAGERFKASTEIGESYLPPPPVKDSVLPEYSYRASKSSFDRIAATETKPSSSDNAKCTDHKINNESNNGTKKKTKNRGKNNGNKSGKPTNQTTRSTISTENPNNQGTTTNYAEPFRLLSFVLATLRVLSRLSSGIFVAS